MVTHPTTNLPACGLCSINSSVGVARVSRRVTPLLIGVTLGVQNREGVQEDVREGVR